jgi:hypothetical protein
MAKIVHKPNFFMFPPGIALASICPACALGRVLTKGGTAVSVVYALKFKKHAMPSNGIYTKIPCALPGAYRLDFEGSGRYVHDWMDHTCPASTHE